MAKFFAFFGWVGTASVVCWIGALVWAIVRSRNPRRYRCWFQAFGLAVLGAILARLNSNAISAIETDRTEEWAAYQEAVRQLRSPTEASEEPGKVRVQFAEDTPGEPFPTVDRTVPVPKGADRSEFVPEYRRRGRQTREPGKKQDLTKGVETPSAASPPTRRMKEPDVRMANRLDRYNLWAVRTVLGVLGILIAGDYLWRHNRIADTYFPLPIGGAWLDALCPKQYSALVTPAAAPLVTPLLEMALRKGESVLYLGPDDPWPNHDFLPVLSVAGKVLWCRRKIVAEDPRLPPDEEFLWDSAWFSRYAVVVTGEEEVRKTKFDHWLQYLRLRARTRASARRTVNVVWVGQPLPVAPVKELLRLGPEMNIRLLYVPSQGAACREDCRPAFAEVL